MPRRRQRGSGDLRRAKRPPRDVLPAPLSSAAARGELHLFRFVNVNPSQIGVREHRDVVLVSNFVAIFSFHIARCHFLALLGAPVPAAPAHNNKGSVRLPPAPLLLQPQLWSCDFAELRDFRPEERAPQRSFEIEVEVEVTSLIEIPQDMKPRGACKQKETISDAAADSKRKESLLGGGGAIARLRSSETCDVLVRLSSAPVMRARGELDANGKAILKDSIEFLFTRRDARYWLQEQLQESSWENACLRKLPFLIWSSRNYMEWRLFNLEKCCKNISIQCHCQFWISISSLQKFWKIFDKGLYYWISVNPSVVRK